MHCYNLTCQSAVVFICLLCNIGCCIQVRSCSSKLPTFLSIKGLLFSDKSLPISASDEHQSNVRCVVQVVHRFQHFRYRTSVYFLWGTKHSRFLVFRDTLFPTGHRGARWCISAQCESHLATFSLGVILQANHSLLGEKTAALLHQVQSKQPVATTSHCLNLCQCTSPEPVKLHFAFLHQARVLPRRGPLLNYRLQG